MKPTAVVFDISGVLLRPHADRALQKYLAHKAQTDPRINLDWAGDVAALMNGLLYKFCPLCQFSICKVVPANSKNHISLALRTGQITYEQAKALKTQMLTHYVKLPAAAQITLDYVVEFSTQPHEVVAETQLIPTGVALLEHLHRTMGGNNLFILSNASVELFQAGRGRFASVFDLIPEKNIMISGHTGILKPDSRAFEQLATKCNVLPNESLFIDDSAQNVQAAREVGFHAVQFAENASDELAAWYETLGFTPKDA